MLLLLALLALPGPALGGVTTLTRATWNETRGVTTLTRATWDETLAEHEAMLVYFFTPGCKHCREFKPEFKLAVAALAAEPDLFIAQVDGNNDQGLCEDYEVTGFPSVLLFKAGVANPVLYVDKHQSAPLVAFVKDELRPDSTSIRSEDALRSDAGVAAQRQRPLVVGVVSDRQTVEASHFREAASVLRRELSFGHCYDDGCESVRSFLKLEGDGIAIVDALNGEPVVVAVRLDFSTNSSTLVEWLRPFQFPLLAELVPSNDPAYRKQPLPMALLLTDNSTDVMSLKSALRSLVAASQPRQLLATYAAAEDLSIDRFNLTDAPLPALVVCKFIGRSYYPFISHSAVTAEGIVAHVAKVLAGDAKPLMRSAPMEPQSVRGVRRLVGTNFEDAVNEPTKDLLVMVYAEWCSHSKQFMSSLEKLSRAMRFVPTVQVAKINMAANDIVVEGWNVEGYPALRLVRANSNNVVSYNGERDYGSLLRWLQKNAAIPFDYDPLEVSFMGHVEGVTSLGDSVRKILQRNRELEQEVQQLRAKIAALPEGNANCAQQDSGASQQSPREEL
jgi:protein disulfide-isomerase A1